METVREDTESDNEGSVRGGEAAAAGVAEAEAEACSFCDGDQRPENPGLRTTFMCGHSVHSECFFHTRFADNCNECGARIWHLRHYNEVTPDDIQQAKRAAELLETSEPFQTAILDLKKAHSSRNLAERPLEKEIKRLKREFKLLIAPHVQAIAMFKKQKSRELRSLPLIKLSRSRNAALTRKFRTILRTYHLDSYGLYSLYSKRAQGKRLDFLRQWRHGLTNIFYRRYHTCKNPRYLFRVRI